MHLSAFFWGMSTFTDSTARYGRFWHTGLVGLWLLALFLRWPYPEPGWIHIDERVFLLNPLKLWSGDLNPHFFIYPTLHIYLTSALYYAYYLLGSSSGIEDFVAYHFFVDGSGLIEIARHLNSLLSAATAVVVALAGRRLYGVVAGAAVGIFFAVLPLSVRFAHMATTDSPAVLWIACALFFSIRIAQTGNMRDSLWAGVFVGLAGATKYPAALVGFPVAVACWLYRPRLRQQALWTAGAVSIAVFALTSPYVVIDAQSAWQDLALMGNVHLASAEAKADIQSWRYYLQYGLRYGIGLLGLLGLAMGLAWRPFARRREEWVVVAAFAVFFFLLMAAESIFMRYALPLAPMVALLWVRPLVALRPLLALLAALALVSEPLYASWQTRALLAGDDAREQVERRLAEEAPAGAWLLHIPPFIGNVRVVHPGLAYSHQRRFLLSYPHADLINAYALLSQRQDLPPLYIALSTEGLKAQRAGAEAKVGGHAYVLWYQHPVMPPLTDGESEILEKGVDWVGEYGGWRTGAVYEAIDWYFAPIGGYDSVDLTGPKIQLGKVPVRAQARGLDSAVFFGVLHGILLGAEKVKSEDWPAVLELYEAIWKTPLPLYRILSSDYYYTYFFNFGIAHDKMGRPEQAAHMWRMALEVKDDSPVLYQNLGVANARLGRLEEARQHLQRALELDDAYVEAHFNFGNLSYQEGKIDAALASWNKVIELDGQHAGAWQGLGNVHYNRQDWRQAITAYKKALDLAPEDASLFFNLAQVYLAQEDIGAAIAALERAVALKPRDAEVHFMLGMTYEQQGLKEPARMSMERALEVEPDHPRAQQIRIYLGRQ